MRDKLTREEAVAILRYKVSVCLRGSEWGEALEMAINALEKESDWIPVSKRSPEAEYGESESVLVCFENETQDVLYFDGSNWCYPTGEVYRSVNHKNGWHNKVIAWMPLLQSYKAERSDEE